MLCMAVGFNRSRTAGLPARRRSEIARAAAAARWSRSESFDRAPSTDSGLASLVAHYGSRFSRSRLSGSDLGRAAIRALTLCRRNPAVARMFPVFLWRVRDELDLPTLAGEASRRRLAPVLGYMLALTARLGPAIAGKRWTAAELQVDALERSASPREPSFLFPTVRGRPFEAAVARERTPPAALGWGLITGMPEDSFESYFRRQMRAG